MTLRLDGILTGLIALLVAALLACAPAGAKGASGGYQLFEATVPGDSQAIQLASLENFNHHAKIAPECCNATKGGLCSFHGDTLVLTDGGLLPIRDLRPQMSVWSRDADTGAMDCYYFYYFYCHY